MLPRIIEPLRSRCAKLRFQPVDEPSGVRKLIEVADNEALSLQSQCVLSRIIHVCSGDLRQSINLLQALSYLSRCISVEDVDEAAGLIPDKVVASLVDLAKGRDFNLVVDAVNAQIIRQSLSPGMCIGQVVEAVMKDSGVGDKAKAQVAVMGGIVDGRMAAKGRGEWIHLLAVLGCLNESVQVA